MEKHAGLHNIREAVVKDIGEHFPESEKATERLDLSDESLLQYLTMLKQIRESAKQRPEVFIM